MWTAEGFDIKANRVCAPCNNRWMNDLDHEAGRFFEAMIQREIEATKLPPRWTAVWLAAYKRDLPRVGWQIGALVTLDRNGPAETHGYLVTIRPAAVLLALAGTRLPQPYKAAAIVVPTTRRRRSRPALARTRKSRCGAGAGTRRRAGAVAAARPDGRGGRSGRATFLRARRACSGGRSSPRSVASWLCGAVWTWWGRWPCSCDRRIVRYRALPVQTNACSLHANRLNFVLEAGSARSQTRRSPVRAARAGCG
jgi:hypothetical protein